MAKNVSRPQTATSRPPGTPDNQIPNQICPHIHFRSDIIDREMLSRKQHLNLLCTPKGYRWIIKKSEADRMDPTKHVFVCSSKRKKTGKTYVHNFLAEIWSLLTPEMVDRLKEMLMNEFGMTAEESVRFICEQRMRTLEISERHRVADDEEEEDPYEGQDPHIPRLIVGDPHLCDRSEFAVGIDPCHIKEFSRTVSNKLSEYVVAMMCAKRNNRHKRMAEVILNGLCNVTGEKCTLDKPKNRLHKILTLVSDRTALWLTDNIEDEDKKRNNERKREDAEIRRRHIEKMKDKERRRKAHEKLAKEREKQEKRRAKQEEEDARRVKEEEERKNAEKEKRREDFEKNKQKRKEKSKDGKDGKDGKDKKPDGKGDGDKKSGSKVDSKKSGGSKGGGGKGGGKGKDSGKGQGSKGSAAASKGGKERGGSKGQPSKKSGGGSQGQGSKPSGDGPKEPPPSGDDQPEGEEEKTESTAADEKAEEGANTPGEQPTEDQPTTEESEKTTEEVAPEESQDEEAPAESPSEAPTEEKQAEDEAKPAASEEAKPASSEEAKPAPTDETQPAPSEETKSAPPEQTEPAKESSTDKKPLSKEPSAAKTEPTPVQKAVEKSISQIVDTEPVSTPRQEAIQDIISKELEKRVTPQDEETKELIRELSAKTATWIDSRVKVVEDEYGNVGKKTAPITQKPKGPIFALKKSDDHINVRRASHLEAEKGIRETRGRVPTVPNVDDDRPMTPDDAKMWAKWAENASQMAEDWGKWIDKTIQDAEEKTVRYKSSGKEMGKEIDVDKQDWETFTGKTLEEALEWRRNRKALEEMAAKWQEKSRKQK